MTNIVTYVFAHVFLKKIRFSFVRLFYTGALIFSMHPYMCFSNLLKYAQVCSCQCLCMYMTNSEFTVWQQGWSFIVTTFTQTTYRHPSQTHWQHSIHKLTFISTSKSYNQPAVTYVALSPVIILYEASYCLFYDLQCL